MKFDVAVIGGSLGGVQAALSAAKENKKVYLCEQSDWVGGQLTSQAVPPDENRWIEEQGGTKTYHDFREAVRDYYRALPEIHPDAKAKENLNPGNAWVSRVAHEPKVAVKILCDMLAPYIADGRIVLEYDTIAVDSSVESDIIRSVTVKNLKNGEEKVIEATYFLDATDCGDLLPVVGAE
ncbi:MAG: FAD-dependent oxidoreductase, partial [Clostridia bacterium]|nr:FAD-dependent oxidoreductase [Clostridia bacterium]